ncbi:hypothetical protein ACEYYH_01465 [Microbacterium trichothecenolyticum]|uniref:hypothetical protein n=1 Tax=Microbacterium trichothecenolyticum TaxID=69370 RepID=UPI0035BE1A03
MTITLPWMRSIPWTCVSDIVVSDFGAAMPIGEVILVRGPDEVSARECSALGGYWTTGERVTLRVHGLPEPGSGVSLEVRVAFFIPYVNAGGRPPHLIATDRVAATSAPIGRAA